MAYQASWYSHQGLMDGTNFWTILTALQVCPFRGSCTEEFLSIGGLSGEVVGVCVCVLGRRRWGHDTGQNVSVSFRVMHVSTQCVWH